MSSTASYQITGMSCQNCANTIERMVSKMPGVSECNVSFATESMQLTLEDQADPAAIVTTVSDLGFTAAARDEDSKKKI